MNECYPRARDVIPACERCPHDCSEREADYEGEPIAYINEFLAALHDERVLADARAAVSRGPWEAPFKP